MILGVVSRLYEQKGLDILSAIVPQLMTHMNLQIALIGTGEASLQDSFRDHTQNYPQSSQHFPPPGTQIRVRMSGKTPSKTVRKTCNNFPSQQFFVPPAIPSRRLRFL